MKLKSIALVFFSQVKDDELEHERKIQEALEKIEKASRASQVVN